MPFDALDLKRNAFDALGLFFYARDQRKEQPNAFDALGLA